MRLVAHSDASKKRPQLREKSWGQVQQRLQRMESVFRSKRRINAALWGVLTLVRQNDLHHDNGDFLRARFIPTFFVRSRARRRIYRVTFKHISRPMYSISERSDRARDCPIEAGLRE
jgi:hypothetical protein